MTSHRSLLALCEARYGSSFSDDLNALARPFFYSRDVTRPHGSRIELHQPGEKIVGVLVRDLWPKRPASLSASSRDVGDDRIGERQRGMHCPGGRQPFEDGTVHDRFAEIAAIRRRRSERAKSTFRSLKPKLCFGSESVGR